ncbi:MAG TPA: hypothetical protein VJH96_02890 [Patescibacteria group bacterium]|nr:hypothetical protein [Patescibacteria group bacterium]
MEIRPYIAHRFELNRDDNLYARKQERALEYILQNDLQCNVISVPDFHYEADDTDQSLYIKEAVKLNRRGLLLALLMRKEKDEDLVAFQEEDIRSIRKLFGKDLPILFLVDRGGVNSIEKMRNNVFECELISEDFLRFINQLKEGKQPMIDEEKKRRAYPEMLTLLQVYNAHYQDDERMFAPPDDNTRIVAEHIRINQIPVDQIKREYDDVLPQSIFNVSNFDICVCEQKHYYSLLEKIRHYTSIEKKEFIYRVYLNMGLRIEKGGFYVESITKGDHIAGFASDPETFHTLIEGRFGLHDCAGEFLAEEIIHIKGIRKGKHYLEDFYSPKKQQIQDRVFSGYLHKENKYLPEFDVPLVMLWSKRSNVQSARKVGSYLISQRKMIPIDKDGLLIDQNYLSDFRQEAED